MAAFTFNCPCGCHATPCCPGLALPDTLHLTLAAMGGCACLNGLVIPITWNGSVWKGNGLTTCNPDGLGAQTFQVEWWCRPSAPAYFTFAHFEFWTGPGVPPADQQTSIVVFPYKPPDTVNCHPGAFEAVYTETMAPLIPSPRAPGCTGLITATVTF